MVFSFKCPSCGATISGSDLLQGRRIRCPDCNTLVEAREKATGTVLLTTGEENAGETVMLEVVEVTEEPATADAMEVTESIEGSLPIEVTELVPSPSRPSPRQSPPQADLAEDFEQPLRGPAKLAMEEAEMDMTPMVDVTFLLLIFFMVTAAFTVQKSIEVPKPAAEDPSAQAVEQDPDDADSVTVEVDEYNTFHVTTLDWVEEAPSEQDLHILLRRARNAANVPTTLRVEAHGDSLHEKVVAALDAGASTGFQEVQLATIEDE